MPLFETTSEQREQLLTDGFVLLPNAVPADLLSQWQDLAKQLEVNALEGYADGERLPGSCVIEDTVGPRLVRYDDTLALHSDAVLELLACPAMMAVAREFCGRGVVPLQFDILYKHQHPHPVIAWHQGAPHPRGYPYLNVGIYLDNADANDGCLKYVPGTQHELQDIGKLSQEHGWDIPGVVEQPAQAGDILVQDMMILHGSAPKVSEGVRRTIYVEFRPAEGILESDRQTEKWMQLRQRWMGLVARRADSSEWPDEWKSDLPNDLGTDEEEVSAIMGHHEPPIPAVYSIENVITENYPFPAELNSN